MGEVLEHVEQPEVFLRRIAELAKDDGYIFITTCINAPAVDHIYLWRTTDELEDMITASGLSIVEPLRLPYEGKSLEESRAAATPDQRRLRAGQARRLRPSHPALGPLAPISSTTSPLRRCTKATVESNVTA